MSYVVYTVFRKLALLILDMVLASFSKHSGRVGGGSILPKVTHLKQG
jgi:hypothetical protein